MHKVRYGTRTQCGRYLGVSYSLPRGVCLILSVDFRTCGIV